MFSALGNMARMAGATIMARTEKLLGKKAAAAVTGGASVTSRIANTALGGVGGAARIGAGLAVGEALAGGVGGRQPRRRQRRFPTGNQMAKYEQAMDLMKGNPSARKIISYKFVNRFRWF